MVYSPRVRIRHAFRCTSLLSIALGATPLSAQLSRNQIADSVQALVERGNASGDLAPIEQALSLLSAGFHTHPADSVLQHYAGYAWYRKGSLLITLKRKPEARPALDSAIAYLVAAGRSLVWPENTALLGAAYGQKIGAGGGNPFTTIRLGHRSNGELDRAAALGPTNPRVFLIRGIAALFKPRLFGGGTDKAVDELHHALSLFDHDAPISPLPRWGHAEAFLFLGMAHQRQGDFAQARTAYERSLALDPEGSFVRDSLLPSLPPVAR